MKKYAMTLMAGLTVLSLLAGCGVSTAQSAVEPVQETAVYQEESLAEAAESQVQSIAGTEPVAAESSAQEAEASPADSGAEVVSEIGPETENAAEITVDAEETYAITLKGDSAETDASAVTVEGSTVTITAAGRYEISGELDGMIIVDTDKESEVELVLSGVTIHSDTSAAIYVKSADKVKVELAEGTVNTLSNGGSFTAIDENNIDGVIFAKDDLTLKGEGTLIVDSPAGDGIVCKDDLKIKNGTCEITADGHAISVNDSYEQEGGSLTLTAGKDGIHVNNDDDETLGNILISGGTLNISVGDDAIHANSCVEIDGGDITITGAEGIEGTYIQINDGTIYIEASDDGINAASKSGAYDTCIEINGGYTTIVMGAGDTDGVDSNGDLVITGGTVDVTGQSTFDYDGTATYTGGTIIANGQQVDTIPNQMMGGMGGRGTRGGW